MDLSPVTAVGTLVAAGLMVLAGVAKLVVPDGAMTTLHALRLPSGRVAARVLGLGEVAAGVTVAWVGGVAGAGAIAIAYTAFLLVAARQRRAQAACGCFGAPSGPVTGTHLAVNATLAAIGLLGLAQPPAPLSGLVADAGGLGTAAGAILLAAAVGLVRTVLVNAADARRRTARAVPTAPRTTAAAGGRR